MATTRSDGELAQAKLFSRIAHQLWVAGTLGALFGIAAKGVPVDLSTISLHPHLAYTLDRGLRWGYLIWLIAFFFISGAGLQRERQQHPNAVDSHDFFYYCIQAILSFGAAYFLGFLVPGTQFTTLAYIGGNFAMFGIAVLAAIRYPERHYQLLRSTGALCSGVGMLVAFYAPASIRLPVLAVLQVGMFVLLWQYYQKRRYSGAADAR
jgi:hypothetical protein